MEIIPPNAELATCKVENVKNSVFFPPEWLDRWALAQANKHAKSFCNRCPEQEVCLQFALVTNQTVGIWGGQTANQRRRLRSVAYNAYWENHGRSNPDNRSDEVVERHGGPSGQ